MRLIGKKILAEKIVTENKTNSGIILGPTANLQKNKAKVLVVGEKEDVIKVGDTITYDQNTAIEQEIDGKDCVFLLGGPTGNIIMRF